MVILFQKIFDSSNSRIKITNIRSINFRDLFPMTKKFFYYQAPWLGLMLIIFIQSSIGSLRIPDIDFKLTDKIVHFLVFGILGILTARGLVNSNIKIIRENYISFTLIICILYGASDEIHQYYVPGRHSELLDWVADVLGILVMVWLYKIYRNHRALKMKN